MKYLLSAILMMLVSYTGLISQSNTTNIDEAQRWASENDKEILMVFSGSDWCKPCIQLKRDILESTEFLKFQKDHLVMLSLDFPYSKKNKLPEDQKKHNEALAEQYNQEGSFPKMVLLDNEKRVIGKVQYKKGMKSAELLDQIKGYSQL